ncbi:hypothetical protein D9M68_885520 [compost metagenome]
MAHHSNQLVGFDFCQERARISDLLPLGAATNPWLSRSLLHGAGRWSGRLADQQTGAGTVKTRCAARHQWYTAQERGGANSASGALRWADPCAAAAAAAAGSESQSVHVRTQGHLGGLTGFVESVRQMLAQRMDGNFQAARNGFGGFAIGDGQRDPGL